MKKRIFSFVLIAAMIGSISTACHSKKKANEAAKKNPTDTMKKDTVKH